ncbi:MAG: lytic transglycosylase domain-containing protein [Acetobacteraceae bacterium]|nr:lytic transglycosylase domain-containing protein [Acetobacteraceae bacterium]
MALARKAALPAALLGALAIGVPAPAAANRATETAMSPGEDAAARRATLPQPLAPADAARLRRVFDHHAAGRAAEAAAEAARIADRRLMGHVLADRWLRGLAPAPTAAELASWLGAYADHPDAPRIHALLLRLAGPEAAPATGPYGAEDSGEAFADIAEAPARSAARNAVLERRVQEAARDGNAASALALIANARLADHTYAAGLRAVVARSLFQRGEDAQALAVALDTLVEAERRRVPAHQAAFAGGLAAWGLGRPAEALALFEAAARSPTATGGFRAAAAFWTARAAVAARRPALYVPWMLQAAQESRSFYGMVARRILGLPAGFAWDGAGFGAAAHPAEALAETAGGWRALALLQIGETSRAEAELAALLPLARGNAALSAAILAAAREHRMAALEARVRGFAETRDGIPRDLALHPMPVLLPQGGYRADPALLYALARQESNFRPNAVSGAGARGLMQIMPATAAYVAQDASLRGRAGRSRLHDPSFSLELGQRYLHYLTTHGAVGDDLIRLLAAYNNGPGNVARWLPAASHRDDPFLFIEAIPVGETRAFVQRVLGFSWIYASRLGLPAPSLDALAAGLFPRFPGPDEVAAMLAAAPPAAQRFLGMAGGASVELAAANDDRPRRGR